MITRTIWRKTKRSATKLKKMILEEVAKGERIHQQIEHRKNESYVKYVRNGISLR